MKKIGTLFAAIVMAVMCLTVGMTASAEDRTIVDSGECGAQGDNVIWTLYDNGELVISGEGAIRDYSSNERSPFVALDFKTAVVESGITRIGDEAFWDCYNMENIKIPDSVTTFGHWSFVCCTNLQKLELSANITDIGESPFLDCKSLTEIIVDSDNQHYANDERGVLFNKDMTCMIQYPIGNKAESYDIPYGVTSVESYAFHNSENLTQVNFSGTETYVGMFTFMGCKNIDNIVFPDSVTKIAYDAFLYASVKNVVLSKNIVELSGAFDSCRNLISVTIPKEITCIQSSAFLGCDNLEAVFYEGTKEEWDKVIIEDGNEPILKAKIYFADGQTDGEHTHFYEDEWIYDSDNKNFYRKCICCGERDISEEIGGIEIETPVTPDADFTVDVVKDYVIIEETISNNVTTDFEIIKAFDINLKNKDGVHIQPDGTVKVKLPNDWSKAGIYKVYRVNDDGTLTDMNAYRQGSHLVFETDHFSVYVIVSESEIQNEPDTPTDNCSCNCHAGGIKAFFFKILNFFQKLFGKNKVCACGVKH